MNILYIWDVVNCKRVHDIGRGGTTSTYVNGKLIIIGGHFYAGDNKFEYLNETWVLDTDTLLWTKVNCRGDIPAARYGHSAHLVDKKIFIFGGRGTKGTVFKDVYYLDLENWTWVSISTPSNTPSSRFFHASELVGRKIVIHGGWDGNEVLDDFWIFNTDLFSWMKPRTAGFSPSPRYGHTLTLTTDGRLFLFGGCMIDKASGIPKYLNDCHVLDTETMVWARPRIHGNLPSGRYGHSSSLIDKGFIVVYGGWGSSGCQSSEWTKDPKIYSLHIFDTHTMTWYIPTKLNNSLTSKPLKHFYNHSVCKLNDTSTETLAIWGGFDGRAACMDFSILTINHEELQS